MNNKQIPDNLYATQQCETILNNILWLNNKLLLAKCQRENITLRQLFSIRTRPFYVFILNCCS